MLFSLSFLSSLSVSAPPPPLPPSIYPNKSHLCLTDATFHWSIKADFSFPFCLPCFFLLLLCEADKPCYKTDLLSGSEVFKCIIKDNTFFNSYHLGPHVFNNFSGKLNNLILALALLAPADYVLTFHHHDLNLNYVNNLEHTLFHCCKMDHRNISLKDSQQSKALCIVCVCIGSVLKKKRSLKVN